MNLEELKLNSLGIDKQKFERIFAFVDFGNVNYWYEHDERDGENNSLASGSKLIVSIEKLYNFINLFSEHSRFYFGLDVKRKKSWRIVSLARKCFSKTITKPIQYIRQNLEPEEVETTTRSVAEDLGGAYIKIPKCNFDVEICIDAIRFLDRYETFCLFSSDADFTNLVEFLKRHKKKIILISSGYVSHWLKDKSDVNINSQQIKKYITIIKQKPRL